MSQSISSEKPHKIKLTKLYKNRNSQTKGQKNPRSNADTR